MNESRTKKNNESLHESNVCVSNLFFYSVIQTNKKIISKKVRKSITKNE